MRSTTCLRKFRPKSQITQQQEMIAHQQEIIAHQQAMIASPNPLDSIDTFAVNMMRT